MLAALLPELAFDNVPEPPVVLGELVQAKTGLEKYRGVPSFCNVEFSAFRCPAKVVSHVMWKIDDAPSGNRSGFDPRKVYTP